MEWQSKWVVPGIIVKIMSKEQPDLYKAKGTAAAASLLARKAQALCMHMLSLHLIRTPQSPCSKSHETGTRATSLRQSSSRAEKSTKCTHETSRLLSLPSAGRCALLAGAPPRIYSARDCLDAAKSVTRVRVPSVRSGL